MLVSLMILKSLTVFLPVVHRCFSIFTDAVPLISGRGLKILRADHLISWPPHIQYASAAYDRHTISRKKLSGNVHDTRSRIIE